MSSPRSMKLLKVMTMIKSPLVGLLVDMDARLSTLRWDLDPVPPTRGGAPTPPRLGNSPGGVPSP